MTEDEYTGRMVRIMRDLYDLKEDVLHGGGVQPEFDGGMLNGALTILRACVDDEDRRVVEEEKRQINARLQWALDSTEPERSAR